MLEPKVDTDEHLKFARLELEMASKSRHERRDKIALEIADVIPIPRNSLYLIRVSRLHIPYHAVDASVEIANEAMLSFRKQ